MRESPNQVVKIMARSAQPGDGRGETRGEQSSQYGAPILYFQLGARCQAGGRDRTEPLGIENSLHWVLDVAFREDDSRVRVGNAPENLALIRKLTHNLLKQETTLKRGIKTRRLVAAWDRKYLLKILNIKPSGD